MENEAAYKVDIGLTLEEPWLPWPECNENEDEKQCNQKSSRVIGVIAEDGDDDEHTAKCNT